MSGPAPGRYGGMRRLAPPRVCLLVHNRLESDPRVSRHARAALRGDYRVAALCVVPPDDAGNQSPRWGEDSGGVQVYESRVLGRSLLGRLRSLTSRPGGLGFSRVRMRVAPAGRNRPTNGGSGPEEDYAPHAVSAGAEAQKHERRGMAGALRDLLQIALLLRNNVGVFRQFRRIGGALVHANDLNVLPAGYLLARSWGVPLLYDSHELWTELDAGWSPFLRRLFRLLEGALIRRADAVVTVNGPIADELARLYGIARPEVVMNCPDLPPLADTAHAGDGAAPVRVIYQGMLNLNRGLIELIDAAATVPEVCLDIRGPGALRERLQRHIEASGLEGRVRLLPPVPMQDLVGALDGYDIGVVPYLPVGKNNLLCSPNKLFEYMAAGLAVVCSDLPVLRSVVEDARCGLLVTPGDSPAMAGALRRLAGDRALLARFKTCARAAAERRYNAEHEEGLLLDLYGRLLHRKGSR